MNSDDNSDEAVARKEVLNAANELRKLRGEAPLEGVPEPPFCSFCGRSKGEVGALAEGPSVYICLACANEAARLLRREL